MPSLWTYPWGVLDGDAEASLADLADRGIDAVSTATHYHSVQTLQPRTPGDLFDRYPGGCYFDPDPERFRAVPIDPPRPAISGTDDPLRDVATAAEAAGLSVNAWTVLFNNSNLGEQYPEYCTEDAFGNRHRHAFCPSKEPVRDYFAAVVGSVADYPVDAVELESVGYPSAFHGHDAVFGHAKRHALTSPTERWLCSQCFCAACRERASGRFDVDRMRERVRRLVTRSLDSPHVAVPPLDALVHEEPALRDLFDMRAASIRGLLERLGDAAGGVDLDCYLMDGFGPDAGDGWPAGVRLADVDQHCDRVTAICYVDDPAVARDRVRTVVERVSVPVDVGITLDPDVIGREGEFRAVADAARAAATGDVKVYHHTLATDAHLDWIADYFAG